jgi:hypothetical protein
MSDEWQQKLAACDGALFRVPLGVPAFLRFVVLRGFFWPLLREQGLL